MDGTKIVTGLVIVSLSSGLGCRAKFQSKNRPGGPGPAAAVSGPVDPSSGQETGPSVPPPGELPGPGVGPALPPPPTTPVTRPPICTTGDDTSIDKNRVVQHQTVVFKRGRQMVWRKNCDGVVVSKQYEILSNNTMKNIVIRPAGGQGPMSVFNRTTCHATTRQHAITPAAKGEHRFTVSTRKTNQAMHVKPGRNYIDYQIGSEQGTLILTVRIDETEGECIVLNARNCPTQRPADWTDHVFDQN